MNTKPIRIGNRVVGTGHPCFIIAEAGVNHNGDLGLAKSLVEVAAQARADAVKFQTYITEKLVTTWSPKAPYQLHATAADESQYEMLKRLELSKSDLLALAQRCSDLGLIFLSTPFDSDSSDLLDEINVPAFKIPSGEITNLPLLRHIGGKGKPVILSTGMADMVEVEAAVHTLESTGNREIIILHCVSNYPAMPEDVNLRALDTLRNSFGYNVGFSDHTTGKEIAYAAVALGASVLEKHFTLNRAFPGPDHEASLEPHELGSMVVGIRKIEEALGSGEKKPAERETETAKAVRKSLVAASFIPAGTVLTGNMIEARRPGTGLPPSMVEVLVGRCAVADIEEGQLLLEEMFQ